MYIVGNGMIAKNFAKIISNDDIIIFASGVSDSSSTSLYEFNREFDLLESYKDKNKKIVYFSSCSVNGDIQSLYISHKRKIESYLSSSDNLIIRLPQVIGNGGNSKTLVNYFKSSILLENVIAIESNSTRNISDIDDVILFSMMLISKNLTGIFEIASPYNHTPLEILLAIEIILGKPAKYTLTSNGSKIITNLSPIQSIFPSYNSYFDKNYMVNCLSKYIL